ncbi:MAG: hypothetical protein FJW30_18630 [Acidobacteria bacterium]|nr:hypothetical protein [Acidobacteriota bacterium]
MSLTDADKRWIEGMFGQVRGEIGEVRDKIERVETNLLTEFHKWASPNEARQRTHLAGLRATE